MTQVIVLASRQCACGKRRNLLSHPVNTWRHADGTELQRSCRAANAREDLERLLT